MDSPFLELAERVLGQATGELALVRISILASFELVIIRIRVNCDNWRNLSARLKMGRYEKEREKKVQR